MKLNIIFAAAFALCAQFAGAEQMESLKDTGVNEINVEITNVALAAPEAVNTALPGLFETARQPSANELIGSWKYSSRYPIKPLVDTIRRISFAVIEKDDDPTDGSLLSGMVFHRVYADFIFTFNKRSVIFKEAYDDIIGQDMNILHSFAYTHECRLTQKDELVCRITGEFSEAVLHTWFPKTTKPAKVEEYKLYVRESNSHN